MTAPAGAHAAATFDPILTNVEAEPYRPRDSRALRRGAVFVALTVAVTVIVAAVAIYLKRIEFQADLERRLEILAAGRVELVEAWLDGLTRPADRIVDSELFRLFATEVDLSGGDIADIATRTLPVPEASDLPAGLGIPLAAQLPFMEKVLTDFAANEDYLAGYLLGRTGVAYVTSAGAGVVGAVQQAVAARVLETGVLHYGPVRRSPAGLTLNVFAPIAPVQSEFDRPGPVGVLMLTAPVGPALVDLLRRPPLAEPGERLRLLQLDGGEFFEVTPGQAPPLRPIGVADYTTPEGPIPFARRAGRDGTRAVYSIGAAVRGPAWWIVQEIDAEAADGQLAGFITAVIVGAVLALLAVIAAFGAFWWRQSNEHNAALAEQFRQLVARIEAQRRLLDSINNTIAEYIGLKAPDGTYRYVNPAFARAIGREVDQAVGLDDAAIFGRGTADRLAIADQRALASGAPVTVNEEVYLGPKLHHLQISKAPYTDESGEVSGTVSVTRDVTTLVEEQRRRERAVQQTVAALVRAVELRDPYLAGHSRRLAGFAVAVAQRLGAGPADVATLDIAANLSQIGKLGVPREILAKPERLTEAEIARMHRHVEHAAAILRDIDFELPVLETICQMHERLDGRGYPNGLSGGQIRLTARILGACDVFCARIEPRAYRAGIAPAAALEILEQNPERYDQGSVAALREVVGSVAGEKLIARLTGG